MREDRLFRHRSAFGKRMEYYVFGRMLKAGLDLYVPLVDDFGIDAIIRKRDGTFVELQIKARSDEVKFGDAALFAAITHERRENYFFVFYSVRLNITWILSSGEFITETRPTQSGINKGKRNILFNGKSVLNKKEHPNPRFNKYIDDDFRRLK